MLITSPIGTTFERTFRDHLGRLVVATFFVYETEGRVKARLVEARVVEESLALPQGIFALVGECLRAAVVLAEKVLGEVIALPQREVLYFAGSKPRAPTLSF